MCDISVKSLKIIDIYLRLLCNIVFFFFGGFCLKKQEMFMLMLVSISPQGAMEWPGCFHVAGDNNPQAVKRAASNICSLLKKNESKER